jgi:hypothetical protein
MLGRTHPISQIVRSVLVLFECALHSRTKERMTGPAMFCGFDINHVITKQELIHVHDRISWSSDECVELLHLAQAIERNESDVMMDALISFQLGLRHLAGKSVPVQLLCVTMAPSGQPFLPKIDLHVSDNGWYQMVYEEHENNKMGPTALHLWDYMKCHILLRDQAYIVSLLFPIATDYFRDASAKLMEWARTDFVKTQFTDCLTRAGHHADDTCVYSNGISYPKEILMQPEFSFLRHAVE